MVESADGGGGGCEALLSQRDVDDVYHCIAAHVNIVVVKHISEMPTATIVELFSKSPLSQWTWSSPHRRNEIFAMRRATRVLRAVGAPRLP